MADSSDRPVEINPFDPKAPARIDVKFAPPDADGMRACPLCGGSGWIYTRSSMGPDGYSVSNPGTCPGCNGRKRVPDFRNAIMRC